MSTTDQADFFTQHFWCISVFAVKISGNLVKRLLRYTQKFRGSIFFGAPCMCNSTFTRNLVMQNILVLVAGMSIKLLLLNCSLTFRVTEYGAILQHHSTEVKQSNFGYVRYQALPFPILTKEQRAMNRFAVVHMNSVGDWILLDKLFHLSFRPRSRQECQHSLFDKWRQSTKSKFYIHRTVLWERASVNPGFISRTARSCGNARSFLHIIWGHSSNRCIIGVLRG